MWNLQKENRATATGLSTSREMAGCVFFAVNGGEVNCARALWQAELALRVAEVVGHPEGELKILGLARTEKCPRTTPQDPIRVTTMWLKDFYDDLTTFGGRHCVRLAPADISERVRADQIGERPAASNFGMKSVVVFAGDGDAPATSDKYFMRGRFAAWPVHGARLTYQDLLEDFPLGQQEDDSAVPVLLVPIEHLK